MQKNKLEPAVSSFQKSSIAYSFWRNSNFACWLKTKLYLNTIQGSAVKQSRKPLQKVPFKQTCSIYKIQEMISLL